MRIVLGEESGASAPPILSTTPAPTTDGFPHRIRGEGACAALVPFHALPSSYATYLKCLRVVAKISQTFLGQPQRLFFGMDGAFSLGFGDDFQ